MAEIQTIQLKGQISGMSRKTRESSGVDFSGMLKEAGQTSSKKDTARTVGEEAGKNTEQNKIEESDKDRIQATDTKAEDTDKVSAEELESTQGNGLTGAEMAMLAEMLGAFSQNVQHSQPQTDEVQALEEIGAVLTEEEDTPVVLMDMTVEMNQEQEAQPFLTEGIETAVHDEQHALVQQAEPHMEVVENDSLQENSLQKKNSPFDDVKAAKQEDTEHTFVQTESSVYSDMEVSGDVMTQTQPTDHAFSIQPKTDTEVVKTSEDTLPIDLSKSIAAKMISRDPAGILEVTLEPATLGKITIKLMYEDGKAALSLISDNPKTLEILSQRAGDIAQILEEKTGQTTIVYTPESPYPEQDRNQQKEQEGHQQEQKEHSSKEHAESFAQQLRLGLI